MANFDIENNYYKDSNSLVVGLDEAGRGPIAGPLVVAICAFKKGYSNNEINDSKQLCDAKRRKLFEIIKKDAYYYDYVIVSEETIDKLNIYQATKQAMESLVNKLDRKPDAILTDAMPLSNYDKTIPFEAIVKGDAKSTSIAAASIIAKVTRDDIMIELDKKYPGYNLAKNKGYCTKDHLEGLNKLGYCKIHRLTYDPVRSMASNETQLSLDDLM